MAANNVSVVLEVIDKATPVLKDFAAKLQQFGAQAKAHLGVASAAAAAAGTAVVSGLAAITKSAIDAADQMGMMAQKVGMSVESFSGLAYAAKMNDVPLDAFKTSITQLNKSLIESQDQGSETANAFKYLGVSTKDSNGKLKSSEQVLKELADAFATMPDGASKSALAMQLMGKSGTDMIPMLNSGADGIRALTDEAQKLGIVITQELTDAANQFNDNLDKMGAMSQGVGMVIAKEMLPVLNNFVTGLSDMISKGDGVQQFGQGVAQVFKFIIKTGAGVVFTIQSIGKTIGAIAAAAMAILSGDFGQVGGIFSALKDDIKEGALATGQFMVTMDNTTVATTKAADSVTKATKAWKDYKKVTKPDAEAEKQKKTYDDLLMSIQREIDGIKQLTFAEQIRFEMEKGRYAFLSPEQKAHVAELLKEADAKRLIYETDKQLKESAENVAKAKRDAVAASNLELQNSTKYLALLKDQGKDVADAWLSAQGALAPLVAQRTILEDLRDKATAANDTQGVTRYQAAIDSLNAILKQTGGELQGVAAATTVVKNETATWEDYVGKTRQEMDKLNTSAELLKQWFAEGRISAEEFKLAMEKINDTKFNLLKIELTDLQKMTITAAQGMQSDMSTFFFDAMQGRMGDLGKMFKNTLDKMVADLLASQLTDYLFGGVNKQSGARGGGALSGIFNAIFGGFRERGGPVSAGVPYIVGERRPEVFIPSTNGTIAPSVAAAFGGGGSNMQVAFNITAMDSQDVMRSLEKIKRPLADLISGTQRTYNK